MSQMNVPLFVRTGNLVTDVKNFSTFEFPSVNAAKKAVKAKDLQHRGLISIRYRSRFERHKYLWRFHVALNSRN